MGKDTAIEWADHTWNPWIGCTRVSPACDHCYAEAMMDHRLQRVEWGGDRKRTSPQNWREPFKWDRQAAAAGKIKTVFCLSLGDIWDNKVDPAWRREAFEVMRQTPNLVYLLLSKRIGNAVGMCDPCAGNPLLPGNAALGATMIDQAEWDRDMPKLKRAGEVLGARFTFASVEPMLGPINARGLMPDWVIVGGESGKDARPMHPDWARSLRGQCADAGVPFLFKQWGEFRPANEDEIPESFHDPKCREYFTMCSNGFVGDCSLGSAFRHKPRHWPQCFPDGVDGDAICLSTWVRRVGKKKARRLLDGVEHNGFPDMTGAS